ncbi:MAG: helix-turn-helix domain-containing protein [Paracoccaceae bacterium]|nr:helix-turn-helix domain-containing protein [Paracoccaceae bacterium]MDG1738029.1 helix-turn-helix domain-containing protein [Paracoccaceae bacterium]MDG2258914.1 helix-turn-helix domain-containing protein [Paracoccaceae bacterium]
MIIRDIRLDRGLSQEQLAYIAGISPRTLQRIERGATPSVESLKCLASALDLQFEDLREETAMQTSTSQTPTRSSLTDEEREAIEYVGELKAFYTHAATFVVGMIGIFIINLMTSPGYLWAIWALVGWGMGLAIHAITVFGVNGTLGADWERRQIEKRLKR